MLYQLVRPALFALDAERAHDLTLELLQRTPALAGLVMGQRRVDAPAPLLGLRFPNRVGLAAGLDKNGLCLAAWERFGFGFVEVGTVTPQPQPGNPRPRMFRLPEHGALINRLGFNNLGMEALARRLELTRSDYSGVLGINIGKNAVTPIERAADDYLLCLRRLHRHADYITVNISSPNTKNLRELQNDAALDGLLLAIAAARRELAQAEGRQAPVLVKIAPDVADEQLPGMVELARKHGMDGLIATNTTLSRSAVAGHRYAAEAGGLSGAPLRARAEQVLRGLRAAAGPDFPLIGVGGIDSGEDALARRAAGADLVQVYTGFIYRGPALVTECARALA
ncbi:quinone-dependent dihydroorotate dehydrogenase [Stagnimonas aquatica]|uniref:Dihydroorotate dehydrogenase (quinone) n=1 Tax=Stagnimonas aquatica TaxID=2689987 RepID=A0A3N0VE80_9GAMM|nr:quinone-dependent dihydroorotate dehydrogenase [Stagnimonas aquatica]ROH91059.1 quinone-dependent dihydroorotate dehydrogenase [Stagnimonas aquatica]